MEKKKEEVLPQIEGYEPEQKIISMLAANLWSVALVVLVLVAGWVAMTGLYPSSSFGIEEPTRVAMGCLWFILLMFLGIVVHELVHGITWLLLLHKGFSHLTFGLMSGGVYCHIDVPMVKRHYVIGALMPLLLVGVVPWITGIASGSLLWMMVGSIMIGCAAGDLMIVRSICKEPAETIVYDHPSQGGCYVYHRKSQE